MTSRQRQVLTGKDWVEASSSILRAVTISVDKIEERGAFRL